MEGLAMEDVIFYVWLFVLHICITAIWYILWPLGNGVVIWYIFRHFGILCEEKSGTTGGYLHIQKPKLLQQSRYKSGGIVWQSKFRANLSKFTGLASVQAFHETMSPPIDGRVKTLRRGDGCYKSAVVKGGNHVKGRQTTCMHIKWHFRKNTFSTFVFT
jgi:hypothetical protein